MERCQHQHLEGRIGQWPSSLECVSSSPANARSTKGKATDFRAVFKNLFGNSQLGRLPSQAHDKMQLKSACLWWLASLFTQQVDESLPVGFDSIGKLVEIRGTLVKRQLAPGQVSSLASAHGLVYIFLGRDRRFPQGLLSAWVNGASRRGCGC